MAAKQRAIARALFRPAYQTRNRRTNLKIIRKSARMAHDRHVQTKLLELKKAQDAVELAVTFAHRWPQQEFNELLLRRVLRVREAAEAVAVGCLPKGSKGK
jgi:hypothetical protein